MQAARSAGERDCARARRRVLRGGVDFRLAYAHGASPGNLLLNLRVYTALTYALTEAPFGMRAIFALAVLFFPMNAFERRWGRLNLCTFFCSWRLQRGDASGAFVRAGLGE